MSATPASRGKETILGETSEPGDSASGLSLSDLYIQACTSMRATDDISLKLLAAVPFVSGVGIALLVRSSSKGFPGGAGFFVSLFAAVVTFAIYRWERRNISNCSHYRRCAAELERDYLRTLSLTGLKPPQEKVPHDRSLVHKFFSRTWGKSEAETLLYLTVIVGWLVTGVYTIAI
jgi:hypothetical protein